MLIKFKNKYTMMLISMLDKGKALGGMPDVIELSVDEAIMIVNEINALRAEQHSAQLHLYKFTTDGNIDARMMFNKDLNDQEKFDIVTNWTKGRLTVAFDGVPLRIIIVADENKKYHDIKSS